MTDYKKPPIRRTFCTTLAPHKLAQDFIIAFILNIARNKLTKIFTADDGTRVYFYDRRKFCCPRKDTMPFPDPGNIAGWKKIGRLRSRDVYEALPHGQ